MAKTGKLLRSLIRAGARTAKLFAAAATPPKPKRRRAKAVTPITPITPLTPFASLLPPLPAAKPRASRVATPPKPRAPAKPRAARPAASTTPRPAAVAPGKWLTAHVLNAAGQRMSYWLYLPSNLPERAQSQGMPLVVMLHGCHQTATQFAQGTRMNLWAEKKGYAVLYPQQLTTIQPQRCWKWYDRATQEGGGDVPTIIAMIHKVLTQYAIDRSRIYVAGISAGAGMANILALNHPGLFAAVGLHSGPVFGAGHNTLGALGVMKHGAPGWRADVAVHEVLQRQPQFPGMPAIVLQGASDNVVRPINQLQLARQSMLLNRLSGEAKATHKPKGRHNAHQLHDFHAGRKLMLRIAHIEQLDHAWSGGDPAFAFNAKAGPDASKMLLDFFARHHR